MINGVIKTSFVDYPKQISYVIFMGGCNMHCPFCHNKTIVDKSTPVIEEAEILKDLEERKDFAKTVTITGGEPTLYNNKLIELMEKIKNLGYLVKLDTNGTNPKLLKEIIKSSLVDYIAMDIKNSFSKYEETCGVNINTEKVKESINLIENGNIDYEFRTTINKDMHTVKDIEEILSYISNKNNYYLQPYKYSKEQIFDNKYEEYSEEELNKISTNLNINLKI